MYSTISVMTTLVALSFYGASQLKFHWVERYDKLLVGSVLCLVGVLTLIFHDHDHDHHGEVGSLGKHLHRKVISLWGLQYCKQKPLSIVTVLLLSRELIILVDVQSVNVETSVLDILAVHSQLLTTVIFSLFLVSVKGKSNVHHYHYCLLLYLTRFMWSIKCGRSCE